MTGSATLTVTIHKHKTSPLAGAQSIFIDSPVPKRCNRRQESLEGMMSGWLSAHIYIIVAGNAFQVRVD